MTKPELKSFQRALMLAYGTDGLKWTTAEKRARIAVIRIIAGLKRKTK